MWRAVAVLFSLINLVTVSFQTLSRSHFSSRPGVSSNLGLYAGLIANLSDIRSAADCAVSSIDGDYLHILITHIYIYIYIYLAVLIFIIKYQVKCVLNGGCRSFTFCASSGICYLSSMDSCSANAAASTGCNYYDQLEHLSAAVCIMFCIK